MLPSDGKTRSSPASGTPPSQFAASLQRSLTAPVHVRVAAMSGEHASTASRATNGVRLIGVIGALLPILSGRSTAAPAMLQCAFNPISTVQQRKTIVFQQTSPGVILHAPMRPSLIAALVLATALPAGAAIRTPRDVRQSSSPALPKTGVRAELLHDLDDMQKKILSLAMAMPAEKYSWRPGRGVRSVSEVYMHVAGANYTLVSFVGDKTMVDTRSFERITDKTRVLEELRRSFDYLRDTIAGTNDADLDKVIRMFGNDSTERAAFIMALNHLHEHLGQSVADARMHGVVPPWSTE